MREYQIVGRKLANPNESNPQLFKMRIFAPNEVVAKSRFFYFLCKLKKVKKAAGEIVSINEVYEAKPMKIKNFGVWIRYDSRSGTHNMYKEYRELCRTDAIKSCCMPSFLAFEYVFIMYFTLDQDMAAQHRARFRSIHIIKIAEISTAQVRRPYIKQLIDPKLKFPLPHRCARAFRPIFAGKRPTTF